MLLLNIACNVYILINVVIIVSYVKYVMNVYVEYYLKKDCIWSLLLVNAELPMHYIKIQNFLLIEIYVVIHRNSVGNLKVKSHA